MFTITQSVLSLHAFILHPVKYSVRAIISQLLVMDFNFWFLQRYLFRDLCSPFCLTVTSVHEVSLYGHVYMLWIHLMKWQKMQYYSFDDTSNAADVGLKGLTYMSLVKKRVWRTPCSLSSWITRSLLLHPGTQEAAGRPVMGGGRRHWNTPLCQTHLTVKHVWQNT